VATGKDRLLKEESMPSYEKIPFPSKSGMTIAKNGFYVLGMDLGKVPVLAPIWDP